MTCHRCGHEKNEHNGFTGCGHVLTRVGVMVVDTCYCHAFTDPPNPDQGTLFEEGK